MVDSSPHEASSKISFSPDFDHTQSHSILALRRLERRSPAPRRLGQDPAPAEFLLEQPGVVEGFPVGGAEFDEESAGLPAQLVEDEEVLVQLRRALRDDVELPAQFATRAASCSKCATTEALTPERYG